MDSITGISSLGSPEPSGLESFKSKINIPVVYRDMDSHYLYFIVVDHECVRNIMDRQTSKTTGTGIHTRSWYQVPCTIVLVPVSHALVYHSNRYSEHLLIGRPMTGIMYEHIFALAGRKTIFTE